MNYPANWSSLPISVKADMMVRCGEAKNYSDACSRLARMRRVKAKPVSGRWWQKDSA